MTEKTLQEKLEAIAEFMDLYKSQDSPIECWYNKKTGIKAFEGRPDYDEDWAKLMLVVEKIEDTCDLTLGHFLVSITGDECMIYHYDFNWCNCEELIEIKGKGNKKTAVFEAVWECINSIS